MTMLLFSRVQRTILDFWGSPKDGTVLGRFLLVEEGASDEVGKGEERSV